jgi:hypothetical protein
MPLFGILKIVATQFAILQICITQLDILKS